MSRFITTLKQISSATSSPLGFRKAQPTSTRPQRLLIVSLPQNEQIENATEYTTGADAVLLPASTSTSGIKAMQKTVLSLPELPWGGWLEAGNKPKIGTLVEMGCDFVVFPSASRVIAVPGDATVGKILQVEPSLPGDLLKAVNELPVDAVLAASEPREENHVTWHQLMLLQRLANSLTKPLLATASINVTADELKALLETEIAGIVVAVSSTQPKEKVAELRKAIDDIVPLLPHKRKKVSALLPYSSVESSPAADSEEEEEEEEE